MQRIAFALTFLCAFLSISNASAAVYNLNLSAANLGPGPGVFCPGYCAITGGPEYSFSGNPGDQVNFGSVTINWDQAYYHGLPEYYNQNWPWPGYNAFLLSDVGVSYNNSEPSPSWYLSLCPVGSTCVLQPMTFDLVFTLPQNGTIRFGWFGSYVYTPPMAPAVPEPATWAMLLIGFAGVGFVGWRRRKMPTTARYSPLMAVTSPEVSARL